MGRNPYPSLVELSQKDPGITVTGRVDDVRPYIERASAYVVPIRIGGGTRLKIYEAMAMGKPVISTTVGAEGLPIKNNTEILLADTPGSFAKQLCATDGMNGPKKSVKAQTIGLRKLGGRRSQFARIVKTDHAVPCSAYDDFKEGVQPVN